MKIEYQLTGDNGRINISRTRNSVTFLCPNAGAISTASYKVSLPQGKYKFEAWGSAGLALFGEKYFGRGAYTKGSIYLRKPKNFYIFIGNKAGFNSLNATSRAVAYGGGASDVRLVNGPWDDFESLKSRIFVAAGGGGVEWGQSIGGNGGQNGTTGHYLEYFTNGGQQTEGGSGSETIYFAQYSATRNTFTGSFGSTGHEITSSDFGGMGGSGYYGGSSMDFAGAGGGGSSYISGHEYCDAIHEGSKDFNNIVHTHQTVHYSKLMFYDTEIISGNETMPYFKSSQTFKGNDDIGAIRITTIGKQCTKMQYQNNTGRRLLMLLTCIVTYKS